MAKGQVTEEELEAGLKSLGGLGGIATSGARRDSPFGTDFVKKGAPVTAVPTQPKVSEVAVSEVTWPAGPEGRGEGRPEPETQSPAPEPQKVIPVRRPAERKPVSLDVEAASPPPALAPAMEKVSVMMTPEMRDAVNLLATRLQRRKTEKHERITANTVMRVAIQTLLDRFELLDGDVANDEQALLDLVKGKFGRR